MTNQDNGDVQQKHAQTIADYVGDMVALESHIEEALDRQLTETQDDPEARTAVQRFHDMVKQHRDTLKGLQEQVGTTAGNPIIAAGSTLLGKAAGVVDLVRTEGISKSLRGGNASDGAKSLARRRELDRTEHSSSLADSPFSGMDDQWPRKSR